MNNSTEVLNEDTVCKLFKSLLFDAKKGEVIDKKPILEPKIGQGIKVEAFMFHIPRGLKPVEKK